MVDLKQWKKGAASRSQDETVEFHGMLGCSDQIDQIYLGHHFLELQLTGKEQLAFVLNPCFFQDRITASKLPMGMILAHA